MILVYEEGSDSPDITFFNDDQLAEATKVYDEIEVDDDFGIPAKYLLRIEPGVSFGYNTSSQIEGYEPFYGAETIAYKTIDDYEGPGA